MLRTVVQLFQSKLGAVGLFVEGITDAAERVRHSALQADTLIAFLQHEKTTKSDRDNCMAMVVNDARLEQDDRRRLLEAIADAKRARQDGQKWGSQILNICTRGRRTSRTFAAAAARAPSRSASHARGLLTVRGRACRRHAR